MIEGRGLFLTAPRTFEFRPLQLGALGPGEVCVRVAGCGLCHTDVSFYSGAVRTKHALPLVLGHEIAGTVVEAPPPHEALVGREVIVPAVIPCGECELCRAGRDNACQSQIMPGNHAHGGFASHVVVPARAVVPLPADRGGYSLAELAVIADAVTTPYQALMRAGTSAGDLVVIIGAGGIGSYAIQIGRALGAQVAAVDIEDGRLDQAGDLGAEWRFNARDIAAPAIRQALGAAGVSTSRWRIFEMSGTAAGQELAWGLMAPAATIGVIGFTMDKPSVRLSNLMAFDATAFGSWGCSPRLYPAVVDLVCSGRVRLGPLVERHPLDEAPLLFERATQGHGGSGRRPILIP
ncbi:MAG: 6-hydroxycyclohex-1-ene-1-carbonyl-CoA dehydrogenase [Betaproteobacteria bacterium]